MKSFTERHRDIEAAWADLRPRVLPAAWAPRSEPFANAGWYHRIGGAYTLLACLEVEAIRAPSADRFDLWAHLSVSAKGRTPFWSELKEAKEVLLGDRRAILVLPPQAEYVNLHPHCLHLYAPLEHNPIPDFRGTNSEGLTAI